MAGCGIIRAVSWNAHEEEERNEEADDASGGVYSRDADYRRDGNGRRLIVDSAHQRQYGGDLLVMEWRAYRACFLFFVPRLHSAAGYGIIRGVSLKRLGCL